MNPPNATVTLTDRQIAILAWLLTAWCNMHPSPTIHEMRESFGLKSTNSIALDLAALRGAGLVRSGHVGASRTLGLTHAGVEVAAWYRGALERPEGPPVFGRLLACDVERVRSTLHDIDRASRAGAHHRDFGGDE